MTRRPILLAGSAALLAAPAAAQVTDFRLQPAPTPTPGIIGPPPETPAPRPSPTPTPSVASTPAAAPPPRVTLPRPTPTPSPSPRAATPAPVVRTPTPSPPPAIPTAVPLPAAAPVVPSPSATATAATPLPSLPSPVVATPEQPARSWWPWIALAFALGAAASAAVFWLKRRIGPLGPVVVPEIERPRVPPAPLPDPHFGIPPAPPEPIATERVPEPAIAATAPATEQHPLQIAIELRKLTLTLMNATLGYRLTLTNAGEHALEDIVIAADLTGAHASLPREAQLAGPDTELPERHRLAGLAPGESGDVVGELRVPLNELRPISQGRAQLFVPLARFRVATEGQETRCFTLVAGQPSASGTGAIQPVRLDYGPRIYDGLAGRAF